MPLHHRVADGPGGHVPAQVDDLIAVVLQHGLDDVLADVMDVPLDGGHRQGPLGLHAAAGAGQGLFQHLKHGLGGLGGAEQLGEEQGAPLVAAAHHVQCGYQSVVHQGQGLLGLQGLLRQPGGVGAEAADHRVLQGHAGVGGGGGRCRRGTLPGEAGHVGPASLVLPGQHPEGGHRVHHGFLVGVEDGQGEPRLQGLHQKRLGDQGAVGQAEGDVGHTQHGLEAQLLPDGPEGGEGLPGLPLLGGDGEGQAVDPHVLFGDAVGQGGVQDAAGDVHPLPGGLGDAPRRTVLLHDGQDLLLYRRIAVDGVHRRLAVVHPQAGLQGGGVGGVQLEGHVQGALQLLDHPGQHIHLVHAGVAHVHVQNVRPRVHLLDAHVQNVVQIPLQQGLLEPLLAGGVDPLPDGAHPVNPQGDGGGAQKGDGPVRPADGGPARQNLPHPADVVRRGAAAAAEDGHTRLPAGEQGLGEGLRIHVVMAVHRVGQASVGLGDHRQTGACAQLLHQREQQIRPQGAVQADGVGPQALQRAGHGGDGAAGEGAPAGLKGQGDQDRQIGVLLDSQQGGPGLVQIGHGLDHRQVGSGSGPGHRHLTEEVVGLLKGQAPHGLQQLPQRAHVHGHQGFGALRRLPGNTDGLGNHLLRAVAGGGQLAGVGPEGVGVDDLAARGDVFPVDLLQQLRPGQVEQLRLPAGGQAPLLEDGAHGPVQKDQVIGKIKRAHSSFLLCEVDRSGSWSNSGTPAPEPSGAGLIRPRWR